MGIIRARALFAYLCPDSLCRSALSSSSSLDSTKPKAITPMLTSATAMSATGWISEKPPPRMIVRMATIAPLLLHIGDETESSI